MVADASGGAGHLCHYRHGKAHNQPHHGAAGKNNGNQTCNKAFAFIVMTDESSYMKHLSLYTSTCVIRHTRREADIQCHGWQA